MKINNKSKRIIRYTVWIVLITFSCIGLAQEKGGVVYEPTWASLDSRPTPAWWRDAKFGIFIHWGLYSVPAWSPKGTYAEWYWHAKDGKNQNNEKRKERQQAVRAFHERVYGADFEYKDFRDLFTCELFDPEAWAETFKRSGARYVVLTSKHHDGYCLWPNKEASESFGMAWNCVESGPKRDLMGDLTRAVRRAGLKMGLYYSLWDWFNPLWPEAEQMAKDYGKGLETYIHRVMVPQFKEMVTTYQPSIIFADGDWWMDDEKWQTRPLLAWLSNEAPNRDEVVINDRWGKVRGQHGGYYTTEYGSGFEDGSQPWEENRGMGRSFGFNRNESIDDYKSEKSLILTLVDLVSRGGNLLLDIGPTADGRIPVIMQDRLIRMGEWLEVNGEAIYGTRPWKRSCQWTEGETVVSSEGGGKGEYDILTMTGMTPVNGRARKMVFFTHEANVLYAILPGWPGKILRLNDIRAAKSTAITLLGREGKLSWQQQGQDLIVKMPEFSPDHMPCLSAWTLRIEGIPSY